MDQQVKFYIGSEVDLKKIVNGEEENKQIEIGALYHCEDTHNTYLGTGAYSVEIYSTASGRTVFGNSQTGEVFNDYNQNVALGHLSHAEGEDTKAYTVGSHTEGKSTKAGGKSDNEINSNGSYAHAEGTGTIAYGRGSHAEGENCLAEGQYSHAEGGGCQATGGWSHAEGCNSGNTSVRATNTGSHAEGRGTLSSGSGSHAEGDTTQSTASGSHSEGIRSKAQANASHAEGMDTTASNSSAHAEGYGTTASGDCSHAEGDSTFAEGKDTHSEGHLTRAVSRQAHAEGDNTVAGDRDFDTSIISALGDYGVGAAAHAEGIGTLARGGASHAEGYKTQATGESSHAEGDNTIASVASAHAEGRSTEANGFASHAEGYMTRTENYYGHAEGTYTLASGYGAHAEGRGDILKSVVASGQGAHAEGYKTTASGDYSHAEGNGTIAASTHQHVQGSYNIEDNNNKYTHIVGNGTSETERSNAHTLDQSGNAWFAGDIYVGSTSGTNRDEGSKKLATEEYVNNVVGQSDWNQNDETAPNYVKNRTHYDGSVTIVENAELKYRWSEMADVYYYPVCDTIFDINKQYRIIFDELYETVVYPKNAEQLSFEIDRWRGSITSNEVYVSGGGGFRTLSIYQIGEIKTLDEKYIPDSIARIDDIVPSDWNQSDENASDYVKNRTHYVDFIKIIENEKLKFNYKSNQVHVYFHSVCDTIFDTNKQYRIVLDGLKETIVYPESAEKLSFTFDNSPGYITSNEVYIYGGGESHTLSIYEVGEVKTLDEKFIPTATDDEIIDLLMQLDMLPALTDSDGSMLSDENGNILLW